MAVTFLAVAVLLVIVLVVVTIGVSDQVRASIVANLESGQRVFASLEARRQRELRAQVATLVENPTLKAAADTYQSGASWSDERTQARLLATMAHELEKLAVRIENDAIVLVGPGRRVLASAGRLAGRWPKGSLLTFAPDDDSGASLDGIVHAGGGVFRAVAAPLLTEHEIPIGRLCVMTSLDQQYVHELAALAGNRAAIVSDGLVVATTLPADHARQFESAISAMKSTEGVVVLAGESYVFRRLVQVGDTSFYGLGSIDESAMGPTRAALARLGVLALGATAMALLTSFWLAQMLSEPIGRLSRSLAAMADARNPKLRLAPTSSSLELAALTDTFNRLMRTVDEAEAQTESAYTGAIRALAVALDARDPYTAGHSERVSVLSVAIGRVLNLPDEQIEVLRLGALLHDIGKIGVPDHVLRKPGPLTPAEFEIIQQHPVLGSRILRSVPFLARHLPIVELHHERPDGRGYPHGLREDDIPLAARIVHVADAYDAITSARAYRAARPGNEAVKELWRCAGTQFHAEIVGALALALPGVTFEPNEAELQPAGL
jgi:putative nucleotidyltransferase with HDIG domain